MKKVTVNLPQHSYEIVIAAGMLDHLSDSMQATNEDCRMVVTDSNVDAIYGDAITTQLSSGVSPEKFVFPAGEAQKTIQTVMDICQTAVKKGCSRGSKFIALGGGVCGDLTGFAASIFMRGIEFIQIPTSLLAMVDSSVGGKTGADLPEGKNLIGTFWQPEIVLIDPLVLKTLPEVELINGLAEVVKYGMILDRDFFAFLEENSAALLALDLQIYEQVIKRCCELKAEVVCEDERESGKRAILNYGHTFGHAIELLSDFKIAHGMAVGIGMAIAGQLALRLGKISCEQLERQNNLLKKLKLMTKVPNGLQAKEILAAMRHDKKNLGGNIRVVLPNGIGDAELFTVTQESLIIEALEACGG